MASSDKENPPKATKAGLGRRLLRPILIGVLALAGFYSLQQWSKPTVDSQTINTLSILKRDSETNNALPASSDSSNSTPLHPLRPLLEIANAGLQQIDANVDDYTATIVSQVFADEELQDERYMACKIRHANQTDEGTEIPFGVYTKFLKPVDQVGREVIWVDGENDQCLIAHLTGFLNLKRVYLDPDGPYAMEGNLHPIYMIGFRNLLVKMIEALENDVQHDECTVSVTTGVELNGRSCTVYEAQHPKPRPHFDFHVARIYIDDELNVPIGYEGYTWPTDDQEPDEPLRLIEKYYYTDLKLNVGLTDADFDPTNQDYDFPAR